MKYRVKIIESVKEDEETMYYPQIRVGLKWKPIAYFENLKTTAFITDLNKEFSCKTDAEAVETIKKHIAEQITKRPNITFKTYNKKDSTLSLSYKPKIFTRSTFTFILCNILSFWILDAAFNIKSDTTPTVWIVYCFG